MNFSVQSYIEDYFHQRNLRVHDNYAVRLASLFVSRRVGAKEPEFLAMMRRISTVFYANNSGLSRVDFEQKLLKHLDAQFRKSTFEPEAATQAAINVGAAAVRRLKRRSVGEILERFRRCAEAKLVDPLWTSRAAGKLRSRPEKIAQGLLVSFISNSMSDRPGHVFRELASGTGFVDLAVLFGTVSHLIEVKILHTGQLKGVEQLGDYMKKEDRPEGWLVVFDARKPDRQVQIPSLFTISAGKVRVVVVNINPIAASKLKRSAQRTRA